jgi:hypothetical protein
MGLMNKLRDMFTEEVEDVEEEPIKKEVIQVEIPAPQQKEEVFEEPPKKEEKVQQPIFFDDNDFANLEPPKKVEKSSGYTKKHSLYDKPKKVEEKQEKKVFKPTPIISPVYGIEKTEDSINSNELQLENTADYEKFDEEIRKTNEFIATLKELQKKLD